MLIHVPPLLLYLFPCIEHATTLTRSGRPSTVTKGTVSASPDSFKFETFSICRIIILTPGDNLRELYSTEARVLRLNRAGRIATSNSRAGWQIQAPRTSSFAKYTQRRILQTQALSAAFPSPTPTPTARPSPTSPLILFIHLFLPSLSSFSDFLAFSLLFHCLLYHRFPANNK